MKIETAAADPTLDLTFPQIKWAIEEAMKKGDMETVRRLIAILNPVVTDDDVVIEI